MNKEKQISASLIMSKNIMKTIFELKFAIKKAFSKNLNLPFLSNRKKIKIIILKIFRVMSSIF